MSNVRRHMRVVVDGVKYEVTTSARDIANAEANGVNGESGGAMFGYAIMYQALRRVGTPDLPGDFDAFIDSIDDFEDLEEEASTDSPTPADR